MYKIMASLIGMLLLAGCATTANYQQKLNQLHGASAQQLINAWGSPDTAIKLPSGNWVYMYLHQQKYSAPVAPAPTFNTAGSPLYNRGFYTESAVNAESRTINLYCRTWFEINRDNVIVNTSFEGNNCVAGK